LIEGRQGVMGAKLRPAAERAGQEVLLVDGGQHLSRGALERPVGDSWNPEGALLRLARLGDIDPPDVRRAISLAVDGLEHRLYPVLEALLRRLHPSDHPPRRRIASESLIDSPAPGRA